MGLHISVEQFADGRRDVRTVSSGAVSGDEARALIARLVPGGDLAGLPLLSVMAAHVELSAEARKAYTSIDASENMRRLPVAIVTPSAPLRVMLSFVLRMAGSGKFTRFFATETDALNWLHGA